MSHDRATITPRLGHDRASIVLSILKKMTYDDRGIDSAMKEPRSRFDGATIVKFFHESFAPSDEDLTLHASL